MDKYVRGKVLGKGSFGCAILVTSKADGKNHVIKEVDISKMPKAEREAAEQEAKLLLALNHPNIVRCSEAFVHQSKLCIVMDYCSEGDLYGIMQKRRGQPLSEDVIMDFFVQMCLGLKHVHDRKILHRDLKSQNVFVSSGGLLKLGDFGVSKVLSSTYQLATTAVGTPYYLSPEICANKRYNQKSDIWSLGCVLYEITVGKHAFEAANMRALIQKIIKGVYPPPPSTRSAELRDLISRMLTLDWNKRPSINDILAMPIMKARITRWLSSTLRANEFSHTIIHGKPKPGQLVVQSAPAAPGMAPDNSGAPRHPTPPPAPSARPASSGPSAPNQRAVVPPPASNPGQRPDSANARNRAPVPAQPGMLAPAAVAAAAGGVAVSAAAKAAEAARQRAISAQREMEVAAARKAVESAEAARREAENRRAREAAAAGANREIERMRLEDARKKLEQDKNRMDADRRAKEAAKVEEAKRAAVAEEARKQAAAADAKRAAAAGAARAREEQEARKKEAERAAKEREKEEARNRMAAQRKEYEQQQRARGPQAGYDPPVQVAVPAGGPRGPRKQWVIDDPEPPKDAKVAPVGGAAAGNALSAEQRRAAFDEGRAELQRNRQRAAEAERHGGIAAFLGVPLGGNEGNGAARLSPEQRHQAEYAQANAARRQSAGPSPEQGRDAYLEGRAAAERNRRNAQDDPPPQYDRYSPPPGLPVPGRPVSGAGADPYAPARRGSSGEADRRAKEAAIVEFQAQHYREMKEAAKRNKQAVMAELGGGGGGAAPVARHPSPLPLQQPRVSNSGAAAGGRGAPAQGAPAAAAGGLRDVPAARRQSSPAIAAAVYQEEDQEDMDFAAMVQDMQDVLVGGGKRVSNNGGVGNGDDDAYNDEQHNGALEGRFMLNGKEVVLPVKPNDPLGLKVEALRMFLERQLGTAAFLKVYHRMEAMCADDDEAEISKVFMGLLGPANLPYLSLVHQLIVCEENMHAAG